VGHGCRLVTARGQFRAWLFVIVMVALGPILPVAVGGGLIAGQLTRLRGRISTAFDDDATPSRSDGTSPTIRGASEGGGLRCESSPGSPCRRLPAPAGATTGCAELEGVSDHRPCYDCCIPCDRP